MGAARSTGATGEPEMARAHQRQQRSSTLGCRPHWVAYGGRMPRHFPRMSGLEHNDDIQSESRLLTPI